MSLYLCLPPCCLCAYLELYSLIFTLFYYPPPLPLSSTQSFSTHSFSPDSLPLSLSYSSSHILSLSLSLSFSVSPSLSHILNLSLSIALLTLSHNTILFLSTAPSEHSGWSNLLDSWCFHHWEQMAWRKWEERQSCLYPCQVTSKYLLQSLIFFFISDFS